MADSKLTGLTANTTPALTDLLYLVDDPGGTPLSQKIALADLLAVPSPTFVTPNIGVAAGTSLALTGGTVTASAPVINATQTWNAAGVTFTGLKLNISNTASAAASLLMDLQVGGLSYATITKAGHLTVSTLTVGAAFTSASSTSVQLRSIASLDWSSTNIGGVSDLFLYRDAAGILAQRNGTNAQENRLYDTYVSSTDYHRLAIKTARATLSGVSGASVTATNLIPDGAVVVGVTTKVTTGLGVSLGTTGYTVGDGTTANRWGSITGTAAGTSSDNRDWTVTTIQAFTAANNVVITATGGNFDATGVIYVSVQYLIGECD